MTEPRTQAGRLLLMSGLAFHSGRRLADNPQLIVDIEEEAAALSSPETTPAGVLAPGEDMFSAADFDDPESPWYDDSPWVPVPAVLGGVAPAGVLDEAWAAAEKALPQMGWLAKDGRWVIPSGRWSVTVVHVESGDGYYEPREEGYKAFATVEPEHVVRGDLAPDPAAALHALAAALGRSGSGT